jgi:hypothetical protein
LGKIKDLKQDVIENKPRIDKLSLDQDRINSVAENMNLSFRNITRVEFDKYFDNRDFKQ